ncbi:SPOR domain-containing protein [Terrihabitans sp. B22-R8]|uniref:SPOR domain-containing protein n=1 Tax=Terrihabitans sp. B22-R8 TaxID=3425128 RepID=UPI00403C3A78
MNDQRRYGSDYESLRNISAGRRQPASEDDPLAELARLVSEGDEPQHGRGPEPRISHGSGHHDAERRDQPHHYAEDEADFFGQADTRNYSQADEFETPETDEEYYARVNQYGQYAAQDGYDYPAEDAEDLPSRRRGGTVTLMAVLGLVALGGVGALGYTFLGGGNDAADSGGTPPMIEARSEPDKTTPEGASDTAQQNKLIYDRVGTEPNASGNVVGGAEEPGERPLSTGPSADDNAMNAPSGPETLPIDNGAGPRRVRTIAIRPDGSVANPAPPADEVAAAAAEPEDTGPIVGTGPVAGGMSMERGSEFGIMASEGANNAASPSDAALVPMPMARPGNLARVATPAAINENAPSSIAPSAAPVAAAPAAAAPAPSAGSGVAIPANQKTTRKRALQPPPIPASQQRPTERRSSLAPSSAPAASAGGFSVQLTSQASEAMAQREFANMQRRYPSILGGRQPNISAVNLPDRGTFYRVRIAAQSQVDAANLCNNLKAAGGDCLVQRN